MLPFLSAIYLDLVSYLMEPTDTGQVNVTCPVSSTSSWSAEFKHRHISANAVHVCGDWQHLKGHWVKGERQSCFLEQILNFNKCSSLLCKMLCLNYSSAHELLLPWPPSYLNMTSIQYIQGIHNYLGRHPSTNNVVSSNTIYFPFVSPFTHHTCLKPTHNYITILFGLMALGKAKSSTQRCISSV
jgi:hypothetical protein